MAKEIVAMILAGGRGSRLYALTQKTAKPAVSFGGKYRIVDFPLSNCAKASQKQIDYVKVLAHERMQDLCDVNLNAITKRQASALIDRLSAMPRKQFLNSEYGRQKQTATRQTTPKTQRRTVPDGFKGTTGWY